MKNRRYQPPKYNLASSFGFALSGVVHALLHERNLRIHFATGALVLYFSRYYNLTKGEYAVVILLIGFVCVCEMLNTAIENTIDLESPCYNPLAKTAKDVAAGAVFVSAATSTAAGFFLFWDTNIFAVILADILARPILSLIVAAIIGGWLILPQRRKK